MISSKIVSNQQLDGSLSNPKHSKVHEIPTFPEECGAHVSRMNLEETNKQSSAYMISSHILSNQQVDGFLRKPKHPKVVYATRTFPEGCGPLKARMNLEDNNKQNSANMISSNIPSNQQVDGFSRKPTYPQGCGAQASKMKKSSAAAMAIINHDHLEARIMSNSFANKSQPSSIMENELIRENPPSKILPPLAINKSLNVKDSSRDKVNYTLYLFQEMLSKLLQQNVQGYYSRSRVDIKAAKLLKIEVKWINTSRRLGDIPGVEVGDIFEWMAELNVIGLHHQFVNGIDYMKKNGKILATSIVASGRYCNIYQSSDALIYSGQGGNPSVRKNMPPKDQKLERGNLALKNSMEAKTPVRVIRGFKLSKSSMLTGTSCKNKVYVYDGLYYVHDYWQERGQFGKLVFKFSLKRILGHQKVNGTKIRKCVRDFITESFSSY